MNLKKQKMLQQILKELLEEAKSIIEQCDIALNNPDYSANFKL